MIFRRFTSIFKEARESIGMALGAVMAHKLRSCLTLLGVLIGVFSIIVTMTAMRVLKKNIENQISQLGSRTFAVRKWPTVQFGGGKDWERYWRRKSITLQQGRQLMEKSSLISSVGFEDNFWGGQLETRFAKTPPSVTVYGESPGSFPARNWVVADGRALVDSDVDNSRDVCVLGATTAKTLFPFGSAIGQKLKINGLNYHVVGVLEPKGSARGGEQDNFAIIPITTGQNRYGRWWRSITLLVQVREDVDMDEAIEEVRGILRVVRKVPPGVEDDFELFSNASLIAQFDSFTKAVRIGVAAISSISLLAAGIGIMNIMLVSVTERTREIGIRRAIGAKKRNIMAQFITEAIVLCEVGGVIGVAAGLLGGNAVALFMQVPPQIPVDWTVLGLVICSIVGIVFGTYPAYKAANLDPIESLRYE
jgi:putative ABC transport system permease protein